MSGADTSSAEARNRRAPAVAVGVDLGGTKTHLLAIDAAGERDERVLPTGEWRKGSLFSDTHNLARLSRVITDLRPVTSSTVVVVGANGCDTPEMCDTARQELTRHLDGRIRVLNDAALLAPAGGVAESIQLIVGTGTIVIGTDADGAMVRVGGHGWQFGDFGSAPGLLRESMRTIVRHDSDGHPPDPLATSLMKYYDVPDVIALAYALSDARDETAWGRHAPLFFEEFDRGSVVARHVLGDAVDVLVRDIQTAVRLGARGDVVLAAGGVVTNQPRFADMLHQRLREQEPGLTLRVLEVPPAIGALELALRDL
jgi:glucosamine kinase